MKTIVLGVGNQILGDDGVGVHVVNELKKHIKSPDITIDEATTGGMNLLDLILGFDRAFIIDALLSSSDGVGTVKKLTPEQGSLHLFSSHGLHFFELLMLGRELQYKVPEIGGIYGIVINKECSFGTALSPEIMKKKKGIIQAIVEDIKSKG